MTLLLKRPIDKVALWQDNNLQKNSYYYGIIVKFQSSPDSITVLKLKGLATKETTAKSYIAHIQFSRIIT